MESDTRFIVTNRAGKLGKHPYEKLYSARGQAENHIKGWKTHARRSRVVCTYRIFRVLDHERIEPH